MTAYRPVCNSCASLAGLVLCFIACFILLVIAPLMYSCVQRLPVISAQRYVTSAAAAAAVAAVSSGN